METQTLSKEQLHAIQHALGCDEYGRGNHYRNRYVCDPGNRVIESLVEAGLMADASAPSFTGGMHCYMVTDDGKRAMFKHSPQPPKLTRSQKRWNRFVESGAKEIGWSFPEWLKTDEGKL
jgi:hypothetical protein